MLRSEATVKSTSHLAFLRHCGVHIDKVQTKNHLMRYVVGLPVFNRRRLFTTLEAAKKHVSAWEGRQYKRDKPWL